MSRFVGRRIASTFVAAAVLAGGIAAGAGTAGAAGSSSDLPEVNFVGSIEGGSQDLLEFLKDPIGELPGYLGLAGLVLGSQDAAPGGGLNGPT